MCSFLMCTSKFSGHFNTVWVRPSLEPTKVRICTPDIRYPGVSAAPSPMHFFQSAYQPTALAGITVTHWNVLSDP